MKKTDFLFSSKSADEYENKRVLVFTNTIILVTICLLAVMSIIKILSNRNLDLSNDVMLSITGILLITYIFSLKGKFKFAGFVYISVLWIAMTFLAFTNEGVKDSAVVAYIVCILVSVHINRSWQALTVTILSILSLWFLTYAEYNQIIIPKPDTALNYSIDLTVILGVVIALIYLNARSYRDYYSRINKEFNERMNVERKLQNREAYYQSIVKNSNDAIFIMKEERFVECNPKALELFKCTREQIVNHTPVDFSPVYQPDGRSSEENALHLIREALEGNPQRFDWQHHRFDGSLFDAEVSLNKIEVNNEVVLLAIVRDISKRKETEKTLRYERALFRTIIDNIPDLIYAKDTQARKIVANLADVHHIGALSESAILNKDDFDIFPRELAEKFYAVDQIVLKTGKPALNIEDYFSDESGKEVWLITSKIPFFDDKGQVAGLVGVGRDITERKKAEEELRKSEERMHLILEKMPILLNAFDEEGKFIVWNKACEEVTGYNAEEIIGYPDPMELFYPDPEYRKQVWEASLYPSNKNNIFTLITKTGEERIIEWFDIYHHLTIPGWTSWGMGLDITERRKAEESLKTQFHLQDLLMNMSATFINMPLENIESGIYSSLEELGEFVNADRVRIWEYDFPNQIAHLHHEWCREGVESKISIYKSIPFRAFPDMDVEVHRRGENISIADVRSHAQGNLRDFLENEGTRSILTVPLMSLGTCIGFVGLNWATQAHSYSNNELNILKFYALMIVNVWLRKKSEEDLLQIKTRLSRGETVAKFGNWELNMDTYTMEASEGAVKLYGAAKSILSLKEVRKHILPEYHTMQDIAYKNLIEKSEPYNLEFRVKHGITGEIIDIHSIAEYDPKRKVIFGTIQDITNRKLSEKAIRESEQKYRELADSIPIGIFETDLEGQITFSNKTALNWFGYNENNVGSGIRIADLILSEDHSIMLDNFSQIISDPDYRPASNEYHAKRKDGHTFPVIISSFPVSKRGEIIGTRGVVIDITQRKLAEIALQESEKKYRSLFETVPIGLYRTALDGKILAFNPAVMKMLGYENPEEVLEHDSTEFWVNPQLRMEMLSNIEVEGIFAFEMQMYTRDNHTIWVHNRVQAAKDEQGRIMYIEGSLEDITVRKLAENALKENEEKLRAIFESSRDAIGVSKNGVHLFANPSYLKLFGFENNEEIFGNSIIESIAPSHRAQMTQNVRRRSSGEPVPSFYESRGMKTNGIEFDAEFSVSTYEMHGEIYSVATIRDITDRKKAEEELHKLFRAIEQTPVSIIITDSEGTVEYANPHFTKLTGYALDEVRGQNPRILKSGHTSAEEYEEMWTKISSGGDWKGELYNKKKNGEFYWEAASISPVINEQGMITHYIAVKEDITRQKETDRRILHAIIEAEENERSRFSRELHDGLGPIMSTVKIYFQWLAENTDPEKKISITAKGNRSIDDAIHSLREISNNLSPRVLNSLGIVSAIQNFINLLKEAEKLFVNFKYNTDRRYEQNIEITLYRITTELINNTLKYGYTTQAELDLNFSPEISLLTLDYIDYGKGFDLNEIMNSRRGLGIVNIQQRVNTLNGKILVKTAPDKGVHVHIEFSARTNA